MACGRAPDAVQRVALAKRCAAEPGPLRALPLVRSRFCEAALRAASRPGHEGTLARRGRRRVEHQRKTVHAVAQAGGLGAVVEDMAEMAAAAAAMDFGAQHAEGAVLGLADRVLQRLPETRPAGAALELGIGREQRQVAAGAGERALAMFFQQRARTRPLGALLAQDVILHWGELRAPFGVGLLDLEFFRGLRRRHAQPAECGQAEQAGYGSKQDAAVEHGCLRAKRCVPCRYGALRRKITCL